MVYMELELIRYISSNYMRARSARIEGDARTELRCLLFAAQDIPPLLTMWKNGVLDDKTAKEYVESFVHTVARIKEIIEHGDAKKEIGR